MALKMKLGRLTGPLNSCEWCDFNSRSWHLFEQHLNRCQHNPTVNAKAVAEAKRSPVMKRKRNYRCNSCDFHAQRPKPLLQHVKEAHQPDLEIFSCELCNYASRFKYKVTQHKRSAHDSLLPIPLDNADSLSHENTLVSKHELNIVEIKGLEDSNTKTVTKRRKHSDVINNEDASDFPVKRKPVKHPKVSSELQMTDFDVITSYTSSPGTSAVHDSKSCQEQSTKHDSNKKVNRNEVKKRMVLPPDISKLIIKDVCLKTGDNVAPNSKIIRYKCQLCSFLNSRKLTVVKHLRSIHGKKFGNFCTKCEFVANSKDELSKHALIHNRRKHKCPDCLYVTGKKREFLEHRACHVISGPHSCSRCSFSSTSESALLTHEAEDHLQSEFVNLGKDDDNCSPVGKVDPLTFVCEFCSFAYQSPSELSNHVSAEHPDAFSLQCSACQLVCRDQRHLKIHSKKKHGISVAALQKSCSEFTSDKKTSLHNSVQDDSVVLANLHKPESYGNSNCLKGSLKVKIKRPVKTKRKPKLPKLKRLKPPVLSNDEILVNENVVPISSAFAEDESTQVELETAIYNDTDLYGLNDVQTQSEITLSTDGTKFICTKCDATLCSNTSLECHLSRNHPGSILYQCPFCSYSCLWRLSMKNHLKIHRNLVKSVENTSILIEQSFSLSGVVPAFLYKNSNTSYEESKMSCSSSEASLPLSSWSELPDCERATKKSRSKKSKLSSATKDTTLEMKFAVGKDVTVKPQADENQIDKFYCDGCNTNCESASKLARHKERHANLKRFMCSSCGLRSNWDFYIRQHLQKNPASHGGVMKVLTKEEALRTIEDYNQRSKFCHSTKSAPNLTVTCEDDDADQDSNRTEYEEAGVAVSKNSRTVVNEDQTEASSFAVPKTVRRRKYHKWFCDQCPFTTDSPAKLGSHKEVHENLKRFLCPVCGTRSNWILYIQAHIRKAHRACKVDVVELTAEEARSTLSDYLLWCKSSFRARKGQSKLKKSKGKSFKKTAANSEAIRLKKSASKELVDEKTGDEEEEVADFAEDFKNNCSERSRVQQVDTLDDSVDCLKEDSLDESPTRDLSRQSSKSKVSVNDFSKYKKYKCSECGMRTNWPAALRRHRLVMHPHAKLVKMPVEEAKATLDLYESQLRHKIFLSNILAKIDGEVKTEDSPPSRSQSLPKKQFLMKLKPPSSLLMFNCSFCDYKSKWKTNVIKHINNIHPGAKVIGSKVKIKKPKMYSCSECGLRSEFLITLKKHVQTVHSTATILDFCSSKTCASPTFSDAVCNSPTLELNQESLGMNDLKGEWLSPEKHIAKSAHSGLQNSPISSTKSNNESKTGCQKERIISTLNPSANPGLKLSKIIRPRNFACSGCPYRGDRHLHVSRHIRSNHPKSNCHVIHLRDRNRSKPTSRIRVRMPESLRNCREPLYKCDICPYRATRSSRLAIHKKMHSATPGYTYECSLCPYYCPSAYCLQNHLQWHKVQSKALAENHLHNDHAYSQTLPPVSRKNKFSCEKCPYVAGDHQHFLYHKQFHKPSLSAQYKCDVCPFWVPEKRMMAQHAKLHECSTKEPLIQNEEMAVLDDVVETARVKWDIVAAKCVPATEKKPAPGLPDVKTNEVEGKTARNKSSSPRIQMASKSFTEMWLNGNLVGSENTSHLDENSLDSLESNRLASKCSSSDDLVRNVRPKENDSDVNKFDRCSASNASGDFELPATRSWHCEKCPYLTIMLINFKRHMSLHGSQQKYECQFCDYSVPRYYLLVQHKKLHFSPNRNLIFSQPITSLQRVAQSDGGSEEFLKEITYMPPPKSASDPVFYEDTQEFRLPAKLFRCDDCPYSTVHHKSLVNHQKHHTVVSAFACPYCSYSINKQWHLNAHIVEHFNLPGSEMSAYSTSEAPELFETMKAQILLLSGINSALTVVDEATDCREAKTEAAPVEEKIEAVCYNSKDVSCDVEHKHIKSSPCTNDDLKVTDGAVKNEEISPPGCSVDDDDDLVLILETNPGSQEDMNGTGDAGRISEDLVDNDTQLALEVESIDDGASEKEIESVDADPTLDFPVVIHDQTTSSSREVKSEENQKNFEELDLGSTSRPDKVVCVIDSSVLGSVVVTNQEETNGNDVVSSEQKSEDHQSDIDGSEIGDQFMLLISDSEPEATPVEDNEI